MGLSQLLIHFPKTRTEQRALSMSHQYLLAEAGAYLSLFHQEHGTQGTALLRRDAVRAEIEHTGAYQHTSEELAYGAQVAWRNSTRCIGRLHWQSLQVRDKRHLSTAQDIFEALVEHLQFATNGGKIRSMITVLAPQVPGQPGIRIWNPQLIRYAGYRHADGTVIGNPLHVELTDVIRQLGWKGGKGSRFDVLPLVIQMPNQPPEIFELPQQAVLEVPLSHPDYSWFMEYLYVTRLTECVFLVW